MGPIGCSGDLKVMSYQDQDQDQDQANPAHVMVEVKEYGHYIHYLLSFFSSFFLFFYFFIFLKKSLFTKSKLNCA